VDVPIVVESENKKGAACLSVGIFLRLSGLSYKIRRILRHAAGIAPLAWKEEKPE
jgi:hypothetical protein